MAESMRNRDANETGGGIVAPLSDLDDCYEVADGDPDVRGWDVKSSDDRTVGRVDDLVVDTRLRKVRYLVVRLDKSIAGATGDRRILVPVGAAGLDDDAEHVTVPLTGASVAKLPAYDKRTFNRESETKLRDEYAAAGVGTTDAETTGADRDFYDHEHFDDARLFGARREQRGHQHEGVDTENRGDAAR